MSQAQTGLVEQAQADAQKTGNSSAVDEKARNSAIADNAKLIDTNALYNDRAKGTYEISDFSKSNYVMCNVNSNISENKSYSIIKSGNSNYWILPLPNQLTYESNYNWNAEDVGLGAGISDRMNKGEVGSVGGIATSLMGDVAASIKPSDIAGAFVKGKGLMQSAIMGGSKITDNVEKEVGRVLGNAHNPNKQLFFTGLDLRQFTLSFSLVPTSKTEADIIKSGFKQIAYEAAPSYSNNTAFFKYPSYFGIAVYINNNKFMERGGLAITSLNLDFTADGALTYHDDSTPTSMQLTVGFQETLIPTRENLQKIVLFGQPLGNGS